jgi:hypothetical protein
MIEGSEFRVFAGAVTVTVGGIVCGIAAFVTGRYSLLCAAIGFLILGGPVAWISWEMLTSRMK